jgi:hypothetical protein
MTAEQRADAVRYLANGGTLREVAAMIHSPWSAFSKDWGLGRGDSENGRESELATWYRESQAARARKRATLRALASETAGTRESGDTLRVLEALESEQEPEAVEDVAPNLFAWSPLAFKLADDLLRELTACGVRA